MSDTIGAELEKALSFLELEKALSFLEPHPTTGDGATLSFRAGSLRVSVESIKAAFAASEAARAEAERERDAVRRERDAQQKENLNLCEVAERMFARAEAAEAQLAASRDGAGVSDLLDTAYNVLARAFGRIHGLPRSSDTELAAQIGKVRQRIERARAARASAPSADAAALSALPKGDNPWRLIETDPPPHNEDVLLGWRYWSGGMWHVEARPYSTGTRTGEYSTISHHGEATHWCPLPAPPSTEGGE